MLTHYNLKVYEKALAFANDAEALSASWGGRHAIVDHLRRFLEIAAASAVKSATYLDLYRIRELPVQLETEHGKELLNRIVAMLSRF